MARTRSRLVFGMVAAVAVVIPAGMAWACVAPVSMTISSNPSVQPGGTVTVVFREFAQGAPIDVHLDTIDGPIIATQPAPTTTMTSEHFLDVTIPANTPFGTHLLVSTQNYHHMNSGNIARATVYVGTLPPPKAAPAVRPAAALVGSGPSGASLFVIGLGVAAAALLVALVWSLAAGSGAKPEAQTAKK